MKTINITLDVTPIHSPEEGVFYVEASANQNNPNKLEPVFYGWFSTEELLYVLNYCSNDLIDIDDDGIYCCNFSPMIRKLTQS